MGVYKFRVWDKERKQMSPVALISFGDDGSARTICIEAAPRDGKQTHLIVEGENGELLQFTGIKDKNGREIYEGDIVIQEDYPWYSDGVLSYVDTVEWSDAGFYTFHNVISIKKRGASHGISEPLEADDEGASQWEIIGNVFQNPDILEQK